MLCLSIMVMFNCFKWLSDLVTWELYWKTAGYHAIQVERSTCGVWASIHWNSMGFHADKYRDIVPLFKLSIPTACHMYDSGVHYCVMPHCCWCTCRESGFCNHGHHWGVQPFVDHSEETQACPHCCHKDRSVWQMMLLGYVCHFQLISMWLHHCLDQQITRVLQQPSQT